MLRGVWGAALHDLDQETWIRVFRGGDGPLQTPRYVIRPASPDPGDAPALDWLLLGEASADDSVLLRAWHEAAARGLGPARRRFRIRRLRTYQPDGSLLDSPLAHASWTLAHAAWPLSPAEPCSLRFAAPLRLLRRKRLISEPTLTDVVVATIRRLRALLPEELRSELARLRQHVLGLSRTTASSWTGHRLDLRRWSGRQHAELQLRGVAGELTLPDGAGPLAPLLAAAQWLHVGKGTTVGLGQFTVTAARLRADTATSNRPESSSRA